MIDRTSNSPKPLSSVSDSSGGSTPLPSPKLSGLPISISPSAPGEPTNRTLSMKPACPLPLASTSSRSSNQNFVPGMKSSTGNPTAGRFVSIALKSSSIAYSRRSPKPVRIVTSGMAMSGSIGSRVRIIWKAGVSPTNASSGPKMTSSGSVRGNWGRRPMDISKKSPIRSAANADVAPTLTSTPNDNIVIRFPIRFIPPYVYSAVRVPNMAPQGFN